MTPRWGAVLAWGALIAVGVTLVGCGQANEYVPPPPPTVFVAHPDKRPVVDELEFTGNTRALDAVDVRARVNGYLKSIEFVDGAHVEQGQLLFLIEPEPFETALASAKASLQKSLASESFARAEVERTRPLVRRGALSQQELDSKEADMKVAAAEVASARAAVEQAELNLNYTRIVAPISGRVGRHLVDVGNLVSMQQTVLTTVEDFRPIHAYFAVSEQDMLRLRATGEVNVSTTGGKQPEIFLAMLNEQGYPHPGKLDFADLGVDPDTGTQLVRAVFDNKDEAILPGMFVRLRLPIGGPQEQVLVDERAISTDQQGEFVLVVGKDNIVERRAVELGRRIEGMRVVFKGLTEKDSVVVNGLQRARPGSPVDPKPATPVEPTATAEPAVQAVVRQPAAAVPMAVAATGEAE